MTTVDPKVTEKLREVGTGSVPVLIVCEDACQSVRAALERAKVTITSTGSMALGSIGAEIKAEQIESVKAIPGIVAIELDEEVQAFGS